MKARILVTGGTGFLGQYVVEGLKKHALVDVLSRSATGELKGDLNRWNAGLDINALSEKKYDLFLHMAALYDLAASPSDVYLHNIMGTDVALQIASKLKIPAFVNISSIAAACNLKSTTVSAFDRDVKTSFPDPYSESKARAEALVENDLSSIQFKLNLRLGILVGDSKFGKIQRLDGPYQMAALISKLKPWLQSWPLPLLLPGNPDVHLPFVPVDQAASGVVNFCLWSLKEKPVGYHSFHLVPQTGVSISQIYQSTFDHLQIKNKSFKLVKYIPRGLIEMVKKLGPPHLPIEPLNYSLQLPHFESETTTEILGTNWCSEFSDYEKIFWSGYEKILSNR